MKKPLALLMLLAVIVLPGCVRVGITGYGDSLIARKADWPADNTVARNNASGDGLISNFTLQNNDWSISSNGWFSKPGTTMWNHPNWTSGLDTAGAKPQTVVYSFGTNDAAAWAMYKTPTADWNHIVYGIEGWTNRAYQQGANLVIWIMPLNWNPYIKDASQQAEYRDLINHINAYLNGKRSSSTPSRVFRTVDWPAIRATNPNGLTFPDKMHPNAWGGGLIGQKIRDIVQTVFFPGAGL